ncbi:MAG: hypothetical protein H5T69_08935 [Chloroflexi bacterium]|nr:hypothetical protein [Chloroflexota bacterium]
MGIWVWLQEAQSEAHDHYGALSIPLGVALGLGGVALELLTRLRWLAWALFIGMLVLALWVGHDWERSQARALGRARTRETLLLRSTWVVLLWCLLWSYLLLLLADARGWSAHAGWLDLPILMMLLIATYHLTMAVLISVGRWLLLGLVVAALAVILPAVPALRAHLWLVAGALVGLALVISGLEGRRALARRLRDW